MIDGFEVMQMIFQVILLTALGQSSAVAKLKPAISPNLRMVFISHTWWPIPLTKWEVISLVTR